MRISFLEGLKYHALDFESDLMYNQAIKAFFKQRRESQSRVVEDEARAVDIELGREKSEAEKAVRRMDVATV